MMTALETNGDVQENTIEIRRWLKRAQELGDLFFAVHGAYDMHSDGHSIHGHLRGMSEVRRYLEKMPCPPEARAARDHLADSMLSVLISLTEALARRDLNASMHLEDARASLKAFHRASTELPPA